MQLFHNKVRFSWSPNPNWWKVIYEGESLVKKKTNTEFMGQKLFKRRDKNRGHEVGAGNNSTNGSDQEPPRKITKWLPLGKQMMNTFWEVKKPQTFQCGCLSFQWSAGDRVLQGIDLNLIHCCNLKDKDILLMCHHRIKCIYLSFHSCTKTLFTISPGTTTRVVSGATFISLRGLLIFFGVMTTR